MIYFAGRNYVNFYGGAEVLIINLVQEFNKRNLDIGLIGNIENEAIKILNKKNAKFYFIDSDKDVIQLTKEDLVIIFTFTEDLLKIKGNPRVIIWSILSLSQLNHNKISFDNRIKNGYLLKYITKMLYKRMNRAGALYFMDQSIKNDINQCFKLSCNDNYLPIPVQCYSLIYKEEVKSNSILKITYLGRGNEMWKIYPIVKVYEDLITQNVFNKIQLYIITDTNKYYKQYLHSNDNMDIEYKYGLKEYELHQFLSENSNLHIAMGTSALDGAICGIPTILIDASLDRFPENYKYKWLYESENFSLGSFIKKDTITGGLDLINVLNLMTQKISYHDISKKCREYVLLNHSLEQTVSKLINIESFFHLNRYLRYCKSFWKYKIKKQIK